MSSPDDSRATGGDDGVEALLPWYVNGTLSPEERARVEARLAEDPERQVELEQLREIAAAERQRQLPEPPGELGLQRLLREARQSPLPDPVRRRAVFWPSLAVAASLVVIVQTALLFSPEAGDVQYAPATAAQEADLQVVFAPDASEASIRALLQAVNAEIIGGPGQLGVYHLWLHRPLRNSDLDAVVEKLRSRDDIVQHASRS